MNDKFSDKNQDGLVDSNSKTEFDYEPDVDKNLMSWSENSSSSYSSDKLKSYSTSNSHYSDVNNSDKNNHSHSQNHVANNNFKKNKMDKGLKVFLIISTIILVAISLIWAASFLATFLKNDPMFNSLTSKITNQNNSAIIHTVDIPENENAKTAEEIYKEIAPSIVGVVTYNPSAGLISSATGQGSGIIISSDGYIVTNSHVIGNSNKYNVSVVNSDNKEFSAKIVGFDTRTDLAVLKIDANNLKAAEFGNSDQLAVGASVLAIGNPGGLEFSNSLTRGVISALNRSLGSFHNNTNTSINTTVKYIQTDAAVNPGNSGGALINMYGQVIGVNSSKASDYEGMGFAIPSNTVKAVVDDIIKNGYVSGRVKMGISVRALSAYEAQLNNVPQGLVVMEIAEGSNAGSNGLKIGDIITKFGGIDTHTTSALYNELSKHKPGDTVNITICRLSARGEEPSTLEINISLIEDKGDAQ